MESSERRGRGRPKGAKAKTKSIFQKKRRSSRLQSMLDISPIQCYKKLEANPLPDQHEHGGYYHSHSAKRSQEVLQWEVPTPLQKSPFIEQIKSEEHSSSSLPSQFLPPIDHFSAPFPLGPVISKPKVYKRQQAKIPLMSSPATAIVDPPTDENIQTTPTAEHDPNERNELGFVITENRHDLLCMPFEDTREADSTASGLSGPPVAMVSHVLEQRLEGTEDHAEQADQTVHFGLTEIVDACAAEESNADEAESAAVVTVLGKYAVKEALAPTVRNIVERHGDVVANCRMETREGRSLFLEILAKFIQRFATKSFAQLSETEIEAALKHVCDLGKVGLNVGWLEQRLMDLWEARRMMKQYSVLKDMHLKENEAVKEKTKALKDAESRLLLAQQEVSAAKKDLEVKLAETESLKTTMANVVMNVKHFNAHPPLHGLL